MVAALRIIDPTFTAEIGYGSNALAFQSDGEVLHSLLTAGSYRRLSYPSLVTLSAHQMSPQAGVICVNGSGLLYWMPQVSGLLGSIEVFEGIPLSHTLLTTVAWDNDPSGYAIAYDQNNDLIYVLISGLTSPTVEQARLVRITPGGTQTDVIPSGVLPPQSGNDTSQPVVTPDGAVWGVIGTGTSRTVFRWDGAAYDTEVLTDPRPNFTLIPRPDNTCWFINRVDNLGWQINSSWNLTRVPLLDEPNFYNVQAVAWTPTCELVVFEADYAWELTDHLVGRGRALAGPWSTRAHHPQAIAVSSKTGGLGAGRDAPAALRTSPAGTGLPGLTSAHSYQWGRR